MKKTILTAVIVAALILLGLGCFYKVEENEYACMVRFSKIVSTTSEAGLHVKLPFVDSVKTFPKAIMLYDISPLGGAHLR